MSPPGFADPIDRMREAGPGQAPPLHSALRTQDCKDPYNTDHAEASRLTLATRIYAQAMGYPSEHKHLGAPPVFYFEPHQTEMCEFKPDVILDITPVFESKVKAMHCMNAQVHLWNYYTDVARRRGTQGGRNSGNPAIVYAEAFQRVYPEVTVEALK